MERNKSKKSGYVTLHLWVYMANMSMKGAIETFQQLKLNAKISAEDIKATDDTIEKFTRDYEKVMKRANDIYDDMEENTKQKKATPEERQEDAEMSQGESDHPRSNLVIQSSFKPESNLGKETTPVEAEEFFKGIRSYFEVSHI